jgi:uncharacterized membrane protein HdeD (DUF308 family)
MGNMIGLALLMGGMMVLAGHIAERRGRSFHIWALIASVIGPLVFPLVYLFPNLQRRNGDRA